MGWIEREYTVSLHSPQLSVYLCSPSLIPLSKITTNQRTLLIKLQACNYVMPTQFSIIRKSTIFWTNYLSRFFSKLHCQSLNIRKTVFAHKLTNEYFNFIKLHKYLFKSRSSFLPEFNCNQEVPWCLGELQYRHLRLQFHVQTS